MSTSVVLATTDPATGVNLDTLDFGQVNLTAPIAATPTGVAYTIGALPGHTLTLTGAGLTYTAGGALSGGTITSIALVDAPHVFAAQGFAPIAAASVSAWLAGHDGAALLNAVLTGPDNVAGSLGPDLIRGGEGPDSLYGDLGADSIYGGGGNDLIIGGAGQNYLRGDDGGDSIVGGADFDDINGNKGDDTLDGGAGNDWVVGGQGNDSLLGGAGNDIVYGNLGDDTVLGGDGDDWVRGGQGDDVVNGGAGNDLIWGDRGSDTLTGGAGADMFHTFTGAGVDRITDFNGAEGDRIIIDDAATFTVAQRGSDAVITLAGGDTVILAGVLVASLQPGWIAYA